MVVVRVQDLNNCLCKVLLLNSLMVIALIEGVKLEGVDGPGIPYTKGVYEMVVVPYYRNVVRNCFYLAVSFLNEVFPAIFLSDHTDISAKFNYLRIILIAHFKRISVFQPVIRYFQGKILI